jgi:hypothetical protein
MARQKRRAQRASETTKGILLGVFGVALLAILVGTYLWVKSTRPQLDAETNCPKSGPSAIHVLLFDRSDPISDQQAQRIRQVIENYKAMAAFGTRFDLYTFEGDATHVLAPKLRICALGKPEDANKYIENPERVRRRYETRFSSVLDQTVVELLRGSTQKTSPIMESIKAATITSFGPVEQGLIPLRVTMISDMIQNTKLYSQFQSDAKFSDLGKNPAWVTLQSQLKGADVDILYLLRPSAQRNRIVIQNRSHELFWEQFVSASGGRLNNIDPI